MSQPQVPQSGTGGGWRNAFQNALGQTVYSENTDGSVNLTGVYFPDGTYQTTAAVSNSTPPTVFNVKSTLYGAKGDGTTDDSAAVIAAIAAAYAAGGGIVFFPAGTYLINSQLSIPNTGGAAPNQPSIRLTGSGGSMSSSAMAGGTLLYGGATLDLRNNAATAKIDTRGIGYLEIDHLTLKDGGSDSATFIFTTNTVLHIHDVSFYGAAAASAGVSALNDAILLGGTSTTSDGTANAPFQGYGTVIRENFFNNIKRAVVGQTYANAIQIVHNTIWNSCGNSNGGAIEFTGVVTNSDTGNYIAGNLFELTFYKYGIRLVNYCVKFVLIGNGFFDDNVNTTAYIRFETNCQYNMVVAGYSGDSLPHVSDVDGTSTLLTSHSGQYSVMPQGVNFTQGTGAFTSGNTNPSGYNIKALTNSDEFYQQLINGAQPKLQYWCKPAGGTAESMVSMSRVDANQKTLQIESVTNGFLKVASGDLKIESANGGGSVWLGDTSTQSVRVTGANLFLGNAGSIIAKYSGVNTVSGGVPSMIATVDSTGLVASVGTTTLYAVPAAGAGQYRLTWNAKITTAGTSPVIGPLTVTYTDPDGTVCAMVIPSSNSAGAASASGNAANSATATGVMLGADVLLNCKASTNIQYAFPVSGTVGSGAWNLHLKLEALY